MRRVYLLSTLAVSVLHFCVHAQWTPYGSPGFSTGGLSNWQDIEIDSNNTVYVSFNDEGLSAGQATVMKYNGSSWVTVGNAGFTSGIAHHSAFCLAYDDTIYFSYADGDNTSKAGVMRYNGSSWSGIGSSLSVGECQYSDIEVTSAGTPYLAFIDNGVGGMVTVKTYNGSSWVNVGTSATISGTGSSFSSLAINSNDEVYVAYQDGTVADSVTVKKFNGTTWVTVGTHFLSQPYAGAWDVSLEFDHNDVPYVAYWNPYPSGPKASVHMFNGTSWTLVGPPSFTTGIVGFTRLAFDNANVPYLTFHDQMLGTTASVMKWNGTSWAYVGAAGFSGGTAAHTAIALDGNDNPYVAYFDNTYSGKTTVMTFPVCEAPELDTLSADTAICEGDSLTLSLNGTLNDASDWYWYSGSCSGTLVDSGTAITVAPLTTTTYYVRGLGNCVASGACVAVTVTVMPAPATPTISVAGLTLTSSVAASYQWYLGSNPIAGANSQQHVATATGWYAVEVSNGNCTALSDSVYVSICDDPTVPVVSASVNPICPGDSAVLTHNGVLNDGARWYWYTGSCGGLLIDSGAAITVTPAAATTYYVRGEGNCVIPGACGSLLLTLHIAPPVPSITVNGSTLTSSAASGNQWYLNGSIIAGATAQTHIATVSGMYSVVVSNDNCSTPSDEVQVTAVGVQETASGEVMRVYPQPFTGELTVQLQGQWAAQQLSLRLFDNTGRMIYSTTVQQQNVIDLGHVPAGLYFLQVSNGRGEYLYRTVSKN